MNLPYPILIEFAIISIEKESSNASDPCILYQADTSDVKEMAAIGTYLKGTKNVTPADHRLESIQIKQSSVCLKTLILPPK